MRLIDADKIYPDVMTKREALAISQGQLAYAPTVEAIPKADYENRLKADMAAMLEEIQLEIEELYPKARKTYRDGLTSYCEGVDDSREIIQQKIDEIKGEMRDEKK